MLLEVRTLTGQTQTDRQTRLNASQTAFAGNSSFLNMVLMWVRIWNVPCPLGFVGCSHS